MISIVGKVLQRVLSKEFPARHGYPPALGMPFHQYHPPPFPRRLPASLPCPPACPSRVSSISICSFCLLGGHTTRASRRLDSLPSPSRSVRRLWIACLLVQTVYPYDFCCQIPRIDSASSLAGARRVCATVCESGWAGPCGPAVIHETAGSALPSLVGRVAQDCRCPATPSYFW